MSPNLRRIAHQALDMFLDALAEESAAPIKKTRRRPSPPVKRLEDLDPKLVTETAEKLKQVGLI